MRGLRTETEAWRRGDRTGRRRDTLPDTGTVRPVSWGQNTQCKLIKPEVAVKVRTKETAEKTDLLSDCREHRSEFTKEL